LEFIGFETSWQRRFGLRGFEVSGFRDFRASRLRDYGDIKRLSRKLRVRKDERPSFFRIPRFSGAGPVKGLPDVSFKLSLFEGSPRSFSPLSTFRENRKRKAEFFKKGQGRRFFTGP
jgi:hypothetical protein